jgi:hypothetical protein
MYSLDNLTTFSPFFMITPKKGRGVPSELKSGGENIPDEPHDLDFLGRRHKEHP